MERSTRCRAIVAAAVTCLIACAPGRTPHPTPSALPPVRAVQQPSAVSARVFNDLDGSTWVRVLPDGGALLNLRVDRQLLRFDSTLSLATLLFDSTLVNAPAFREDCLRPFRGDSSLFVVPNDPESGRVAPVRKPGFTIFVLDGGGRLARKIPLPPAYQGAWSCQMGSFGFDDRGAIISSWFHVGNPNRALQIDSEPLLRFQPDRNRLDTLTWLQVATFGGNDADSVGTDGRRYVAWSTPVFMPADEWALTSGGAVAVIRWRDYRIDWVSADGSQRTTKEIPWPWHRLSKSEKQGIVDSVAPVWARVAAEETRQMWADKRGDFVMIHKPAPASEVIDYAPPFVGNRWATRTDDVGNIWVRSLPTTPVGAGTLYDVIDPNGRMVDRVLFAPGRSLLGVAGRNAYLAAGPLGARRLERVVVK